MPTQKIGAVILAGGRSTRQRGFKPLLPIGGQTVIQRCLELFQHRGVADSVVVLGYRGEELRPKVEKAGARAVVNPDFDQGMFSSIQAGVAALSPETDAFFVLPVDIPLVRPLTIRLLLRVLALNKSNEVFLPSFQDQTGHPPLLRTNLRSRIATHDGTGGLRRILETASTVQVPVPDQHILVDIDTPTQYEYALTLWQRYCLPTPQEAEVLLDWETKGDADISAHSRQVASVTKRLALQINSRNPGSVDVDLAVAGALLHDIAKGQPRHADTGAKHLKACGFAPALTAIVAQHADYEPEEKSPVTETELVYTADKLVQGSRLVGLDSRFRAKYEAFAANDRAQQAVLRRWEQARRIRERVEAACGCDLDSLV